MQDGGIDRSKFFDIYQQWSNLINNNDIDQNGGVIASNKNGRMYSEHTIKKMILNSTYGSGIGINTSTIRPTSSIRSYNRGLSPNFIALDEVEITPETSDLNQFISIEFKLPESLLSDKSEKPKKLKINFEEDAYE